MEGGRHLGIPFLRGQHDNLTPDLVDNGQELNPECGRRLLTIHGDNLHAKQYDGKRLREAGVTCSLNS